MSVPHRLQPTTSLTDNLAYANDNFDKLVNDIGDLGAKATSTGSTGAQVVTAGSSLNLRVGILAPIDPPSHIYDDGIVSIVPRIAVFIDNDNNSAFIHPSGGSLSSDQLLTMVNCYVDFTPATGTLGSFVVTVKNFGASSHTYYVYYSATFLPKPTPGNFA